MKRISSFIITSIISFTCLEAAGIIERTNPDILEDARLDTTCLDLLDTDQEPYHVALVVMVIHRVPFHSRQLTRILRESRKANEEHRHQCYMIRPLDKFSLIKKYGYPCEIHRVYTEDKYILEMHRVPRGRADEGAVDSRPVVFLQHGLLSSSAEWVLMTPGKGLAYLLADSGYDVWMGNARGNSYSRSHATMKPTSSSFWKFSWHEIGYYDLPAMIDYVIKETGVPKIQYIGFSQGTTAFWVMTSTRPEYNAKIIAMQALAPIAFIGNIKSPLIRIIAPFTNSLETVLKLLGTNEILPDGKINEIAGKRLCTEEAFTQVLCTNLLFLICGFNDEQLNKTMLPVVLGHTPAGASTRQIIHFGQLFKSNNFQQFDNGWIGNMLRYGSFKPPEYDLRNIRTPVFLHYSDNDWLSTPDDVHRLSKEVKSVVGKFRIPMKDFNHLDFVFAINATELIYNRLLNIMEQFK